MKHLILFDCDGTLTDSNGVIVRAIQWAFRQHDLAAPSEQAVLAVLGMDLNGVVLTLLQEQGADVRKVEVLAAAYRQHYVAIEDEISLYPKVMEVLQTLKERGYWMAVVTGKSKSGLMRVLQRFELHDYFYAWRTPDCTHSKPHPAMALECMYELGSLPEQTTLLGDSHFDIQMAKAAGVRALGACFSGENSQRLYDEGAEDVLTRFEDLLAYFPPLD